MTSARRHAAMIGTWRRSAKRSSSVDVRARRTPPPARMTGRSAEASSSMTARMSSSAGRAGPGRPPSTRASVGRRLVEQVLGQRQQDRARAAAERLADRLGHGGRDLVGVRGFRRPLRQATDRRRPGRSPGTPRGPGASRATWPTIANIGVESWRAVWMPIARFEAPTARVPRQAAGRPVSWPWASAMNAAAPSWRVATTRMPASPRASRRPRNDSPGTVKA